MSPLASWLPAGDRMGIGVVEPGFLWGPGLDPCAGVRCQGILRVGCLLPPYSWGWARLRSRQVTPGAPGSLWPRGVVVGLVVPPVWTRADYEHYNDAPRGTLPPVGNLPDSWGPVTPMNPNNYHTTVLTLTIRLPFAFGWPVGEAEWAMGIVRGAHSA